MSKRPPALAGKRSRERQLLDREQREHDRRDLLKNGRRRRRLRFYRRRCHCHRRQFRRRCCRRF